jgi:flagellar protein FliO/FliZ
MRVAPSAAGLSSGVLHILKKPKFSAAACRAWRSVATWAIALGAGDFAAAAEALPFAAGTPQSAPTPMAGTLRVTLAMFLVLGALFGAAWLARRVRGVGGVSTGALTVLAQVSLGARERAVLLRVGALQVLVGVAPGNVRTLHVMDEAIEPDVAPTPDVARPTFKSVLLKSLGK